MSSYPQTKWERGIAAFLRASVALGIFLSLWGVAVCWASLSGWLRELYAPYLAILVVLGISVPFAAYLLLPHFQEYMKALGQRRIILFHSWRIPAALLFFWYGLHGQLPSLFWIPAGIGDLVVGCYALYVAMRPKGNKQHWRFHILGFSDFVIAVGMGLVHTLLSDPQMAAITTLPLALIPFWGVGISGASHLLSFHLLRQEQTLLRGKVAVGGIFID